MRVEPYFPSGSMNVPPQNATASPNEEAAADIQIAGGGVVVSVQVHDCDVAAVSDKMSTRMERKVFMVELV